MEDKIMTTQQLLAINARSTEQGYNRLLDEQALIELLEEDGIHLLIPLMVHEHKHGVLCPAHLRCRVYLKVKGSAAPVRSVLDVSFADAEALVDAKAAVRMHTETRRVAADARE